LHNDSKSHRRYMPLFGDEDRTKRLNFTTGAGAHGGSDRERRTRRFLSEQVREGERQVEIGGRGNLGVEGRTNERTMERSQRIEMERGWTPSLHPLTHPLHFFFTSQLHRGDRGNACRGRSPPKHPHGNGFQPRFDHGRASRNGQIAHGMGGRRTVDRGLAMPYGPICRGHQESSGGTDTRDSSRVCGRP